MRKIPYLIAIILFSTTAYAFGGEAKVDEKLYSQRIDSLNKVLAQLKLKLNYITFDVLLNDYDINQKVLPTADISSAMRKISSHVDSLRLDYEKKEKLSDSLMMQNKEYNAHVSGKINIKKFDQDEYNNKKSQLIFKIKKENPHVNVIYNERIKSLCKLNVVALREYIAMCKLKKVQVSIPLNRFKADLAILKENPEYYEIVEKANFISRLIRVWTSALYDPKPPKKKDDIVEPPKYIDYAVTMAAIDSLNSDIKALKYSLNYLGYNIIFDEISFKNDISTTFGITEMMATRDDEIKKSFDEYKLISAKADSIRMTDNDFAHLMTKGFSAERYPNITYKELIRRLNMKLQRNKDFCDIERERIKHIAKLNITALKKYREHVIANNGFIRINSLSNQFSYMVKNSADYSEIESQIYLLEKKKYSYERSICELIQ